jgi:hypothetical protein
MEGRGKDGHTSGTPSTSGGGGGGGVGALVFRGYGQCQLAAALFDGPITCF